MAVCPVHGSEFKLVPGGVSKRTGKPYNAFFACVSMGCKEKPPVDGQPAPQVNSGPVAPVPPATPDSVWEAKDRQSAMQSSVNFAGNVFQGHPDRLDDALDAARRAYHELIRPAFRNTVARSDEGQKVSNAVTPPVADDEINVDDIPF